MLVNREINLLGDYLFCFHKRMVNASANQTLGDRIVTGAWLDTTATKTIVQVRLLINIV